MIFDNVTHQFDDKFGRISNRKHAPYKIGDRSSFTVSINVHGAFPKIDSWSDRTDLGERTLRLPLASPHK